MTEQLDTKDVAVEFPKEIQLTELELAKVVASTATLEKTQLEIQMLEGEIQKRRTLIRTIQGKQMSLMSEISTRLGVDTLSRYQINMENGSGRLVGG